MWELLSILGQAQRGWEAFASRVGSGYAAAWNQQNDVLKGIADEIQHDRDRDTFILSVVTAGLAGGLLGGAASGAFKSTSEVVQGFATNAASDAASQFGGSAVSYFQSHGNNPFKPAGIDPTQYSETMKGNIGVFFLSLQEAIGDIVRDIESGKSPQADGEWWYGVYKRKFGIESFPSTSDLNSHDFQGEASLCLWIQWGAQRNFQYWDRAWASVQRPKPTNLPFALNPASMEDCTRYFGYLNDIKKMDRILDEMDNIDPTLTTHLKSTAAGPEAHIDLRKLKNVGTFSDFRSAQVLSKYFAAPNRPTGAEDLKRLLLTMNEMPSAN